MTMFYYISNVHKNLTKPLGRPIIAGIDSLTSALSQYIDRQLQKYVTNWIYTLRTQHFSLYSYRTLHWNQILYGPL